MKNIAPESNPNTIVSHVRMLLIDTNMDLQHINELDVLVDEL